MRQRTFKAPKEPKAPKKPKTFIEDDDLLTLANEVIKEKNMDDISPLSIRFLLVDPYISKTVVGKCIKPSAELKHFGKMDYLIEFSNNVWQGLSEKVKKIVMEHELKHIFVTHDKKGNTKYKILDHNVKDFYSIIKEYGVDWLDEVKTIASSVNDFENGEQDKLKI